MTGSVPEPVPIAVAILRHSGRVLVRPRPASDSLLAGCWEFPGGRIEEGESAATAAARELKEETRLTAPRLRPYLSVEHHYPDRTVSLHFHIADLDAGQACPAAAGDWTWLCIAELSRSRFPEANQAVIARLLDERGAMHRK